MLRLIFLGPPGVGKGTQASLFSGKYQIPHIATGDLLRRAISEKKTVGLKAKSFIEAGRLVPDTVIIELMRERLEEADVASGYVLDGFPRTVGQGSALSVVLEEAGLLLDRVIYFSIDNSLLMERIVGRRSCPSCHSIYHLIYRKPTQEGQCDCGTVLIQRKDDRPDTVEERLLVYQNETEPLIAYYKKLELLAEIKADESFAQVTESIEDAIKRGSLDEVL